MKKCEHDFVKIIICNKEGGGWRKICRLCHKVFPFKIGDKVDTRTFFKEVQGKVEKLKDLTTTEK